MFLVELLVPIVAMTLVFGPFFYWIKRRFDLKERQLAVGDRNRPQLESKEMKLLRERLENLETIVCSSSMEERARLAGVLDGASGIAPVANGRSLAPSRASTPSAGAVGPDPGQSAGTDPVAGQTVGHTAGPDRPAYAPTQPAAAQSSGLQVGDVLQQRYRIQRELGRGGMGVVYLADDEVLGEPIALKVISSSWSRDPAATIERFRREVSAARRVTSPNVVRIHDLGEAAGGALYISMEYLPGQTLAHLLQVRGMLSPADTKDVVGQICDGLTAAHDAGVIHRDLKPRNVIVGERNAVKIIDFGLAKMTALDGMTATGLMLGTPENMSPEQVRGLDIDARSDLYSLGALTYHAVTGQPPFQGKTPIGVGFAHCSEMPRPPRALRPEISAQLEEMIMGALAKDPTDRPASAYVFRQALALR